MGHTNSTVNYNLPQFVGTDKPSWLGDVNGAFLAIDTAIAEAKSQADSAAGGVAGLQTVVGGHTTQIGTLTDTVTAQGGTLNAVTALIGNGTPTTTDQTIIGAINELAAIVEAGSETITTSTVDSDLRTKVLASVAKGRVPYIVAEYTKSGYTFHNVIFKLVQTGFNSTDNLTFSALIDENNIRVIYVSSAGTDAQDSGATLGTMKIYY